MDDEAELTPEVYRAFQTAGQTLGIGISGLSNLVNPGGVLLYLPPSLAGNDAEPILPGSAVELYRQGIEAMVHKHAFFDAGEATTLKVEPLEREWRRYFGTKSAGLRMLDSFVQYAKRRCKCYDPAHNIEHRPERTCSATTAVRQK